MLGELIGESRGKRIVRRTLSSEPLKVEVTFEDAGTVLGVAYTGFGTYWSEVRPDGTVYGEGEGAYLTQDAEIVSWRATGLGRIKAGGAVSYRGMLYFRTASQKLARLNTVGGAFEYEADADGSTHAKTWEWK
ncbi:MAG: hypothetical protein JJE04_24195 [Acidobacteriia bacterium]|nr:hypothetical protein [Terriglobia bacterium]